MPIAIMVGDLFGLHHQVGVVGAQSAFLVKLEGFQEIKHLEHREALSGRRCFVDGDVAISALEWLTPARFAP
jgi:hypothetical protein